MLLTIVQQLYGLSRGGTKKSAAGQGIPNLINLYEKCHSFFRLLDLMVMNN
jgi:hypothetical protein